MTTLSQTLRATCQNALLAGVVLSVLLTPTGALAAEREGTVLSFYVEDLQQTLSHPSLSSLLSFSQPSLSFAWREQSEVRQQDGRLERATA
jgi:hypothetical protein